MSALPATAGDVTPEDRHGRNRAAPLTRAGLLAQRGVGCASGSTRTPTFGERQAGAGAIVSPARRRSGSERRGLAARCADRRRETDRTVCARRAPASLPGHQTVANRGPNERRPWTHVLKIGDRRR